MEYSWDAEEMNKRIKLPTKAPEILFHCLLSHEAVQFWKITNTYFFAKHNIAFLFCTLLSLHYEQVGLDNSHKWKENQEVYSWAIFRSPRGSGAIEAEITILDLA